MYYNLLYVQIWFYQTIFFKTIFGVIALIFGIVYIVSLIIYNINDPGFNTYSYNSENIQIKNYFGIFGSYLSSYSFVIIGVMSYSVATLILIECLKSTLGIITNKLILKSISHILGAILLGIIYLLIGLESINVGLLSTFLSNLVLEKIFINLNSQILIFLINLVIFVLGTYLFLFSFSINLKFLRKIFNVLNFLKYLRYIFKIRYLLKLFPKNSKSGKLNKRSEPTIKKTGLFDYKKTIKSKKNLKQLEIDQFKFSLPSFDYLNKSSNKNNYNKEIDRQNEEFRNKLEKTLSEYGVEGNVIGYKTGPIVTLFEFIPNAGIKSSKIIALSDDIARAMSSLSARIASQPGKMSLGIEIPNKKRESVLFGDLVEDDRFEKNQDNLTLALGKDISGEKNIHRFRKDASSTYSGDNWVRKICWNKYNDIKSTL